MYQIAKELGEYTRKNYKDASGSYRVSTSTDWGVREYRMFINQNPWNTVININLSDLLTKTF